MKELNEEELEQAYEAYLNYDYGENVKLTTTFKKIIKQTLKDRFGLDCYRILDDNYNRPSNYIIKSKYQDINVDCFLDLYQPNEKLNPEHYEFSIHGMCFRSQTDLREEDVFIGQTPFTEIADELITAFKTNLGFYIKKCYARKTYLKGSFDINNDNFDNIVIDDDLFYVFGVDTIEFDNYTDVSVIIGVEALKTASDYQFKYYPNSPDNFSYNSLSVIGSRTYMDVELHKEMFKKDLLKELVFYHMKKNIDSCFNFVLEDFEKHSYDELLQQALTALKSAK